MAKSTHVVTIDEAACIGCTKCIQACPVDAIVGATKQLHTVLSDYCIGCNLCLPPCPTHCIQIIPIQSDPIARKQLATVAKTRHQQRKSRLEKQQQQKHQADIANQQDMKSRIQAAITRTQQKRPVLSWDHYE